MKFLFWLGVGLWVVPWTEKYVMVRLNKGEHSA
jgi:hypothetical protein